MNPALAFAGGLLLALLSAPFAAAFAEAPVETPSLEEQVASGKLPPVTERLPDVPAVADFTGKEIGRHGGEITWIARRARDVRIMNVYGYARLVGYDQDFQLKPDILESIDIEDDRVFTMHLRPGHRWSDGAPFTAEDFRYWWEDVAQNVEVTPYGPDIRLQVDGEWPRVEILDETTVRYSWSKPNPAFLPALAGASPLYLFSPAHYMKQFHAKYADAQALKAKVAASGERNWAALHIVNGDLFESTNPDLPVLEPWVNRTRPPSSRFVFERNPFYHRIDPEGRQLPYLDRIIVNIADSSLIPAKTGAGESDLQARSLRFDNITFLKEGEERNDYTVRLWPTALGSEIALYPNLNAADPVWRELNRDVRFRRALSLGINREEINQVIYFGLARPGNNTVLPESPLYRDELLTRWASYDPDQANALLDEMGLTERNGAGIRLLSNGQPLEIVVESAGERSEEVDAMELIIDGWRKIGVGAYLNQSQRDVWYNRIYSGEAVMSIWFGLDNALITPNTMPIELAPVQQVLLQYPAWGQYYQTKGDAGTRPDLDWAKRLMTLYDEWRHTAGDEERGRIISEMLEIHADQVTSIGTVQGVLQPVVVSNRLRNVPQEAIYSWDPGAHFGVYRPDTFWVVE
ncbi:MAG TPA: ABC transporter substrate-binding protein [Alphaproteobacteria bacterium]|nr:ABC transporter substrate-binding protein [Alphaproteobacteria bacterium]